MNAKEFVDSLFKDYEQTAALADFKEELLGNLNAKIENLEKKGMDAQAAFAKASAELGDVSALADELSLKKRKEVFEEVYMDIRNFMDTKRVTGYVAFVILALFGIMAGLMIYFSTAWSSVEESWFLNTNFNLARTFSVMLPFLTVAAIGFTFLGVTQETASVYPLSKKRSAWYAAAAGLVALGLFLFPVVFFRVRTISGNSAYVLLSALAAMVPFVLLGTGIFVFLGLTEKNRLKPWAKEYSDKLTKQIMESSQNPFPFSDGATASRFGMFSGAIWIFAVGFFILLGFLIGFQFSWLIFVFAVAVQLLVQGLMSKRVK